MKSIPHHSLVVGLMVMGLGLVAGGSWLVWTGDRYEAAAAIKVDPDGYFRYGDTPSVKATQSSVMFVDELLADTILEDVVEEFSLHRKWSSSHRELRLAEAKVLLRSNITLQPIRNTMLLRIHVRSADPEEAAALANSLADHYQERIRQQMSKVNLESWRRSTLIELERRKLQGESKIIELEKMAAQLRTTLKVLPTEEASTTNKPTPEIPAERTKALEPYYDTVRELSAAKSLQKIIEAGLNNAKSWQPTDRHGTMWVLDRAITPNTPASANHSKGLGLMLIGFAIFPLA